MTAVSPDVACAANDVLSRLAPTVEPLTTFRKVQVFYRVDLNGNLYYSARYRRVRHRNSYTIAYEHAGCLSFGQIQYYIAISQLNTILVVVQKCVLTSETAQQHFNLSTSAICTPDLFHFVSVSPSATVIDVSMIKQKCLLILVYLPSTLSVFHEQCKTKD